MASTTSITRPKDCRTMVSTAPRLSARSKSPAAIRTASPAMTQ
jgi:hypothetical protein